MEIKLNIFSQLINLNIFLNNFPLFEKNKIALKIYERWKK